MNGKRHTATGNAARLTLRSRSPLPLWLATLAVLATYQPASAQRGGGAAATTPAPLVTAAQLRALDAHIEQVRAQWEVPGLAVAIVQGDSVVFAKGYGVKELGKPDRVDEHTLFSIGSSGKSMTVAVVATLVDEGRMRFDDPVWQYLPRFRVADPYVSREATIRDLLAHRTGLENATGVWYGSPLTRAQIVDRLRFLEQDIGFRSGMLYNNLMLMVAGEAAAAAAGKPWEELVRERVFAPLGMSSTLSNPEELTPQSNVASPHMPVAGQLTAIPHRNTRNISPAGGDYSSARDMAQYLRFQLGNGVYRGKRIVSAASMAQMRSVLISNAMPVVLSDSGTTALGYGMGWFTDYYRGHRLLRHGGAIDGMLAEMMFLPEGQIGVVVLTNRSSHTMHTALTHHIFDVALGLSQRDWNGQALSRMKAQETQAAERLRTWETQRAQNAPPSLPLEKYAGTYHDSMNGDVRVTVESGGLQLQYHPGFTAKLEPWQYNTFRLEWQNPNVLSSPTATVTFTIDQNGRPAELRLDPIGTFRAAAPARGPGARSSSPAAPPDYSALPDAPYTAENMTVPTAASGRSGPPTARPSRRRPRPRAAGCP
jgi:CubicO group peptidase (beta-lactamase class C family)